MAPLTDYQVQVCGNAGFGTTADCDLAATTTAATSEAGHFSTDLIVEYPPVPCPCVVKATPLMDVGRTQQREVSTPIAILGAPVATPIPPQVLGKPSGLVVDRADLVGATSWSEWFGGTVHRTLVLQLRDAGPNLIPSTPFVLRSGSVGDPTQVVGSPYIPPLHPGQTVSFRVPVTFPPLAHGDYVVVGTLGNTGQIVTFKVSTQLMPWGIILVLAMVILVAIVLLVGRIVRRSRGSDETDSDTTPAAPATQGLDVPGASSYGGVPVAAPSGSGGTEGAI